VTLLPPGANSGLLAPLMAARAPVK